MTHANRAPPVLKARDDTDDSLRVERDTADIRATKDERDAENRADAVVQLARDRAVEVLRIAREDSDNLKRQPQPTTSNLESERERADTILQREHAHADLLLDQERMDPRRYLAGLLKVEREATDSNLFGERHDADTAIAARDEFLATVSHDLRSLLGGLGLDADLIAIQAREGAGGDTLRQHAAKTNRTVATMSRLLDDLIDVVRVEAGDLTLLLEEIEVAEIVSETLGAFEEIAAKRRIKLEATAAPNRLVARLDGGRLLRVLANLVDNALKFTAEDGRICIHVEGGENEILFAVRDTGDGIPEAALPRVLEPFRPVTKDRHGFGLGLHISKGLVEAHGGRMWVESTVGVGSTFYFVLPRAPVTTRDRLRS